MSRRGARSKRGAPDDDSDGDGVVDLTADEPTAAATNTTSPRKRARRTGAGGAGGGAGAAAAAATSPPNNASSASPTKAKKNKKRVNHCHFPLPVKASFKDVKLPRGWGAHDTILVWQTHKLQPSTKIAAFDYDGCLAKTSLYKKGPDAWSVLYPEVPIKLKQLCDDGFKLVIVTNEGNIGRFKSKGAVERAIVQKTGRLTGFMEKVGLPFQVLCATSKDQYRKPNSGAWDVVTAANGGLVPDMDACFYVGDAAGRARDHSDSDKEFARAAGLRFYTETQYFKDLTT